MSGYSEYLLISDDRRCAEIYRVYDEGSEKYRVRYYSYRCKSLDSDYENHNYIFEESHAVGFLEMSLSDARQQWTMRCNDGYGSVEGATWRRDNSTELKITIPRKKAKARKKVDMRMTRRYTVDIALSE